MKRVFALITLLFCVGIAIVCAENNNTYERNGNNFTKIVTIQQSTDVQTVYTYTIKDTSYPIWITKNGRCYIIRISKNGNEYKQYLEESISREIAKEMNIEYKEK